MNNRLNNSRELYSNNNYLFRNNNCKNNERTCATNSFERNSQSKNFHLSDRIHKNTDRNCYDSSSYDKCLINNNRDSNYLSDEYKNRSKFLYFRGRLNSSQKINMNIYKNLSSINSNYFETKDEFSMPINEKTFEDNESKNVSLYFINKPLKNENVSITLQNNVLELEQSTFAEKVVENETNKANNENTKTSLSNIQTNSDNNNINKEKEHVECSKLCEDLLEKNLNKIIQNENSSFVSDDKYIIKSIETLRQNIDIKESKNTLNEENFKIAQSKEELFKEQLDVKKKENDNELLNIDKSLFTQDKINELADISAKFFDAFSSLNSFFQKLRT